MGIALLTASQQFNQLNIAAVISKQNESAMVLKID